MVMAERIELSEDERTLSNGEFAEKFGVSRATAWRARQRGWLWVEYHSPHYTIDPERQPEKGRVDLSEEDYQLSTRKLAQKYGIHPGTANKAHKRGWFVSRSSERTSNTPDLEWVQENAENLIDSARIGVLSRLRIAYARYGKPTNQLLRPFDVEDALQEAFLRLVEASGDPRREDELWRIRYASRVCQGLIRDAWKKYQKRERPIEANPEEDQDEYQVKYRSDQIFFDSSDIERGKEAFRELIPEEILEIAAKKVDRKKLTEEEEKRLQEFRDNWGWLMQ